MNIKSFFRALTPCCRTSFDSKEHLKNASNLINPKIDKLLTPLQQENEKAVKEINRHLCDCIFDLEVFSYDRFRLIVAGSNDFCYYHNFEIVFEEVFYFSGVLWEWRVPYEGIPLRMEHLRPEPIHADNADGQIFIFSKADGTDQLIVGASTVSYNTDTVYYYEREGLKKNERISSFCRLKSTASL